MKTSHFVILLLALPALAGCSRMVGESSGPALAATQDPAAVVQAGAARIDVGGFVSAEIASKLSDKDKSEAASAQFYALQFGRPGAPRSWQGDGVYSGRITVGPYVRVNNLDCRDFHHQVSNGQQAFVQQGIACRDGEGVWTPEATI